LITINVVCDKPQLCALFVDNCQQLPLDIAQIFVQLDILGAKRLFFYYLNVLFNAGLPFHTMIFYLRATN